jgi:hypothetical protein
MLLQADQVRSAAALAWARAEGAPIRLRDGAAARGGVPIRTGAEAARAWDMLVEGTLQSAMQPPQPALATVAAPAWEMRTASLLVRAAATPTLSLWMRGGPHDGPCVGCGVPTWP